MGAAIMTPGVASEFEREFDELLRHEGLRDPQVFAEVEAFDEVPFYSRYSQLAFLADLPVAEQNRQLIRASVRHLVRIVSFFHRTHEGREPGQVVRLISITGWWDDELEGGRCTDGTSQILTPNFWTADLRDARMKHFALYPPESDCAAFVSAALGDSAEFRVYESRIEASNNYCPRRVYVCLTNGPNGSALLRHCLEA
jgi:hypothetical protein